MFFDIKSLSESDSSEVQRSQLDRGLDALSSRFKFAGMAEWLGSRVPLWLRGFDPLCSLQGAASDRA
jgi:hypothetical protein